MAGDSHGGFAEKLFTVGLAVLLIGGGIALGVSVLGNKLERWGLVDVKYVEPPAASRDKFGGVTPSPSGPAAPTAGVPQSVAPPTPHVTQRTNPDGSVTTTKTSVNPKCAADPALGESITWTKDGCIVTRPIKK